MYTECLSWFDIVQITIISLKKTHIIVKSIHSSLRSESKKNGKACSVNHII